MLNDLTTDQLALAEFMSELSEAAYFAGWMSGLEYALWQAVLGQRGDYGHLMLRSEDVVKLRALSEACHGWIVFDEEKEETWLPISKWGTQFANWQASHPATGIDG